jgi:hypothetical protein
MVVSHLNEWSESEQAQEREDRDPMAAERERAEK